MSTTAARDLSPCKPRRFGGRVATSRSADRLESIDMEPIPEGARRARCSLIAGAMLLYFGVRNLTAGNRGHRVLERRRISGSSSGLTSTGSAELQAAVIDRDMLVNFANWVYIWGHWPVILPTALALFLCRRERYYVLRNAFFVSGAIGFLFFALLPVAPPRLFDLGLVDTVTSQSSSYRALQPPGLTNQYAALPSLHVGWNVLLGIVLFTATRRASYVSSRSRAARDGVRGRRDGEPLRRRRRGRDRRRADRADGRIRPQPARAQLSWPGLRRRSRHPHGPDAPVRHRAPRRQRPRRAARRGASRRPVRRS